MIVRLLILGLLPALLITCGKDEATPTTAPVQQQNSEPEPELVLSSDKQMTSFGFAGLEINGVTIDIPGEIDEEAKTIAIEMPSGTEITALEPELETPDNAVYEPTGPQDFSTPINYTITAEDGTSRTYLVTVDVALSQKEILLLISEANPGNTLNWNETADPSDWDEVILDGNGDIIDLKMNGRRLTIIPPEIGKLGSLEILNLNFNNLSSLPSEIAQLGNLKKLLLSNNELSSLFPEIGQLGSLTFLALGNNNLSSLPLEIGQLGNLEILDLTVTNLSNLPPEIGLLSSLVSLKLGAGNLSNLPPEIGQLGNLEILDLRSNNLSSLPPEIGQLSNLKTMFLGNNNLSSLPAEIKQLVNLKLLHIQNNNLSAFNHVAFIPSGGIINILDCAMETNLEQLLLSGNPGLENLNQCICDLDLDKGGTVDIDVVPDGVNCVDTNVIGN